MGERVESKVQIRKIESMETWIKIMGKYKENGNHGKFGKYEIGKY